MLCNHSKLNEMNDEKVAKINLKQTETKET